MKERKTAISVEIVLMGQQSMRLFVDAANVTASVSWRKGCPKNALRVCIGAMHIRIPRRTKHVGQHSHMAKEARVDPVRFAKLLKQRDSYPRQKIVVSTNHARHRPTVTNIRDFAKVW